MVQKPVSNACLNNQQPILECLQSLLAEPQSILEIGSGTGQHAVYFAKHLSHLRWQTSDLEDNHAGINAWLNEAALDNCLAPITLDIDGNQWPQKQYDALFTANTLHICSWQQVTVLFQALKRVVKVGGLVMIYGPFNYNGQYTSESNARFDQLLKDSHSQQGIRDFEQVNQLAIDNALVLQQDMTMPANNRLLVFKML